MHYVETWHADEEHKMAGLCDGFLVNPDDGSVGVLEIKTKNAYQFEFLEEPDDDYILQVQWYMAITGLEWAYLLYWKTGGDRITRDLKGFYIPRDNTYIEQLRTWCARLRTHLENKHVPSHRVCDSPESYIAKYCPVRDLCFNGCGSDPSTH